MGCRLVPTQEIKQKESFQLMNCFSLNWNLRAVFENSLFLSFQCISYRSLNRDSCSIHKTHNKHLIVGLDVACVVLDHRPLKYTSVTFDSKKKILFLYLPIIETIRRNTIALNSDIMHTNQSISVCAQLCIYEYIYIYIYILQRACLIFSILWHCVSICATFSFSHALYIRFDKYHLEGENEREYWVPWVWCSTR